MRTRIEGHTKGSICITTDGLQDTIKCENSIIKFWLSSGTILGMKLGSKLYPNTWKIRILYGPINKNYYFKQCVYKDDGFDLDIDSDIFETEEEVMNYRIIPIDNYIGDDI